MDYLAAAMAACESKRFELIAKGYREPVVAASIDRAKGTALRKVQPVSQPIRERAFYDILISELTGCESWCKAELSQRV